MDANKSSLLAIFEKKMRIEVPLFQRQYIWDEERQWQPLWEDIERKFADTLSVRTDAPVHFLGAMVLDQKATPTTHVERRQVIDGQQRLITLQIFLAAFRDFCGEQECAELAKECENFTLNRGMMADPDIDRFKVWPTQLDRSQFVDVITAGSRDALLAKYPLRYKKYARKPDPRPRMVDAYLFYYNQLETFFCGESGEVPLAAETTIAMRLEECFQTLRNALMVVVIDLQEGDDPQVIFETLNARGEPLLPADLLKNYIFLRATRSDPKSTEALYEQYWKRFDDEFWRVEVKQGRLTRPRSDLYKQHFLSSRQGQDIPIKHLYVEYRHWIERERPFANIEDELKTLARQGDEFRRILEPNDNDPIRGLVNFLDIFDIRTAYPLLLAMFDAKVDDHDWNGISQILESYLLRRAVCIFGTKNYNRIFLALTRNLRANGFSAAALAKQLLALTGDSGEWPDDSKFSEAWLNRPMYGPLNNPKLIHLFSRLNQTFMSSKSEPIAFSQQPTVEHILPQEWHQHWPLPNGLKALDFIELMTAQDTDPNAIATRRRNNALQSIGNLTILSTALNSAQSNSAWELKRPEMMKHSLLPINQPLFELNAWDEDSIKSRAQNLLERALSIWPRGIGQTVVP
jgi:uncharacterized protein with ParB-like and HNH nuclease domain